jgi:hypothetical protein
VNNDDKAGYLFYCGAQEKSAKAISQRYMYVVSFFFELMVARG